MTGFRDPGASVRALTALERGKRESRTRVCESRSASTTTVTCLGDEAKIDAVIARSARVEHDLKRATTRPRRQRRIMAPPLRKSRARGHDPRKKHGDRDQASGDIKRLPVTSLPRCSAAAASRDGGGYKDEDYTSITVRRGHPTSENPPRLHHVLQQRRQVYRLKVTRAAPRLAPVEGRAIAICTCRSPGREVRAVSRRGPSRRLSTSMFATKNGFARRPNWRLTKTSLKADGIIRVKMRTATR